MVDHYLVLDKLHHIGLNQNAVLWFNSYLHNRHQYVYVNGCQSSQMLVDTGVPQGSVLGPLLFSIFINYLPQLCTTCHVHLYADDTVIYTSNPDISRTQHNLQQDFNIVQQWLNNNRLVLNMKKSCTLVFGTKYGSSHSPELHINFSDGTPLERVNVFKYLGLWMDPELTFKPHIDYICKRIYGCLGSLYQSINWFSFQVRKRIISQLLLPILDYADVVYQNTTDSILKPI